MRTHIHHPALLAPSALLALVALGSLSMAACSNEKSGSGTTTSWPVVTVSTTVPSSSTSEASTTSSTSSTSSTTSTTVVAIAGLELSSEGLGDALFGASDGGVYAYVQAILGDPTADSGWIDPQSTGAACPGTEVRFVTWDDLVLTFSDESPQGAGYRHFAGYTYGPAFGPQIAPAVLETEGGIGVGDAVSDLQAVYPGAVINSADDMSGPSFFIEEGLFGFLSGTGADDLIISFVGGSGCGE